MTRNHKLDGTSHRVPDRKVRDVWATEFFIDSLCVLNMIVSHLGLGLVQNSFLALAQTEASFVNTNEVVAPFREPLTQPSIPAVVTIAWDDLDDALTLCLIADRIPIILQAYAGNHHVDGVDLWPLVASIVDIPPFMLLRLLLAVIVA